MWELFSTDAGTSGFRLQYMELLNWGTFDAKVVRIAPEGNNSLLTGANASGKSTFIDALLTLLVPMQRKRFYNQSSGVEKRGDRTEETYVLGHYGNILKEGAASTTSQMLRQKNEVYSVILASFANSGEKVVTLFQLRWFSNGELKRSFGVAHRPLTIVNDFGKFDARGEWRKRLESTYNADKNKRKVIEFFDGPKVYAERMQKLFGMRSENALSLFNQMVGVKVLDDLDEFIRTNMLEEKDVEELYRELKDSFLTLTEAKNNIEKAKLQIELLEPISEHISALKETQAKEEVLQTSEKVGNYWFAEKYLGLATTEIVLRQQEFEEQEAYIAKLEEKQEAYTEQMLNLKQDIRNDAVGLQLEQLKKDKQQYSHQKEQRVIFLDEYNTLAQGLAFATNPTESVFKTNREVAQQQLAAIATDEETQNELLVDKQQEQKSLANEIQNLRETIEMLHKNRNNISGREAAIRDEILQAVGATKDEIPFVGELIKVKDSEKAWEYAIEKVLHTVALHLIVPVKFYSKVNAFVNSHNLKGRIRYYKYDEVLPMKYFGGEHQLLAKIEIKEPHNYANWVEQLIEKQYNFTCVSSIAEFEKYTEMVLTQEGLIKYRKGRHEKDDRELLSKRSNYVLGWDNKEKMSSLGKELQKLQQQAEKVQQQLAQIKAQIASLRKQSTNISVFLSKFEKFESIHWQEYALLIQGCDTQIQELEKTNDRMRVLQQQLNDLTKKQNDLKREIQDNIYKSQHTKGEIDSILGKKAQTEAAIQLQTPPAQQEMDTFASNYPELQNLQYTTFDETKRIFEKQISNDIRDNEAHKAELKGALLKGITEFKNPSAELLAKFPDWWADVNSLPSGVEVSLLTEYQQYLQRLQKDNLPKYEKRFQEYLHETTIHKMGSFGTFFDNWSDEISENIRHLNSSLKEISFKSQPDTYIQLVMFQRLNSDISEFRELLRKARANINEISSRIDGRKDHFEQHIAPFIKRLEDESWRKKVLDVRLWYSYKAEEFYKETGAKAKTYEGMGQLSGGEKAQLTYTILGSAIAYQFGLLKDGLQNDSFRFIAIDEAFKAQDEDKARYLITLCKQLHLQLLVVTPSDNIHIVENDIAFVHFVSRGTDETSHLINMPIEQFKNEREKYQTND